jgi:hypothetical protein
LCLLRLLWFLPQFDSGFEISKKSSLAIARLRWNGQEWTIVRYLTELLRKPGQRLTARPGFATLKWSSRSLIVIVVIGFSGRNRTR